LRVKARAKALEPTKSKRSATSPHDSHNIRRPITTRNRCRSISFRSQDAEAMLRLARSQPDTPAKPAPTTVPQHHRSGSMAGACPRERTDINRHLEGALVHFLRNPLNQQLPRKFKISFLGLRITIARKACCTTSAWSRP
jgi:hypothetical protein